MPQLDPTSFASQLFWLTLCFVALYVLLARFVLPRIHDVLESRQDRIDHDLGQAAHMKQQAEAAKIGYEKSLQESRAKAQALLAEAQASIQKESATKQAELDRELAQKMSAAEAELNKARKKALADLVPASGQLAGMIVETLVHQKPSAQEIGAAVDSVAKERAL